jgi:hypothetical protein
VMLYATKDVVRNQRCCTQPKMLYGNQKGFFWDNPNSGQVINYARNEHRS